MLNPFSGPLERISSSLSWTSPLPPPATKTNVDDTAAISSTRLSPWRHGEGVGGGRGNKKLFDWSEDKRPEELREGSNSSSSSSSRSDDQEEREELMERVQILEAKLEKMQVCLSVCLSVHLSD